VISIKPILPLFDKNSLFDGKSLWRRKDPVKEKNRAKGREIREASEEKGTRQGHPQFGAIGLGVLLGFQDTRDETIGLFF
jgi:hypothetical protein